MIENGTGATNGAPSNGTVTENNETITCNVISWKNSERGLEVEEIGSITISNTRDPNEYITIPLEGNKQELSYDGQVKASVEK